MQVSSGFKDIDFFEFYLESALNLLPKLFIDNWNFIRFSILIAGLGYEALGKAYIEQSIKYLH